jgi:hypothetical protein
MESVMQTMKIAFAEEESVKKGVSINV